MWMRIMGLRRAMQSMTERSQTVEGMCSTAGRCGSSHSDSVKISARPALSIHHFFWPHHTKLAL